jgi:SAM-dependent methyltransferase
MRARVHRAPHQVVRYAPALRLLRALPPGARVLEVGSGVEGVATWWRRPFVGVDLGFEGGRLAPTLRPVAGDATRLPFADRSFDLVVCVGVLTVLRGDVTTACAEVARVSRGVAVVASPCGPDAEASDRRNLAWCRSRGIRPPRWFVEQLERGLPSPEAIRAGLDPAGDVTEHATLSVSWNGRLFRFEQRARRLRGMTGLQPALRVWGRVAARELAGDGPPYERAFVLRIHPTVSPPRRRS